MKKIKWFLLISFLSGSLIFLSSYSDDYFEISKNLDIFSTLYKEINNYYVEETKPGDLMKQGIDAMLSSLDPYTNYIPESDIEDYRFMTTGQYGGIGSVIRQEGDYVMIAEPYDASPSVKSGLLAGDIILEVDGKSTKGKTVSDLSKTLKGQPKTEVVLKIKRPGTEAPFDVKVTREEIKVKDVPYYGMINEHTGYIKLTSFTETASSEVKTAFKDLKDKHAIKSLILDLRDNGGGLLREAVNIVNLFVEKGQPVVETKGKVKEWDRMYRTLNEPLDTQIPLVVLIDQGSASASEIVSGALQDLDRAVIIGENSYGKGLVQQTFDLSYNAKVKVTVSKYYIPSGRCIQKLDYGNKDEQGKALQTPDSLLKEFSTKNGRKVKEGDGIKPDIYVQKPEPSELTISLYTKNHLFDFATQYRRDQAMIDSLHFSLPDQEFIKFKGFLEGRDYSYQTQTEKLLADLKQIMEEDQMEEDLKNNTTQLIQQVNRSKKDDLDQYKQEIKELLEEEIVSRYYFQKGRIRQRLKHDKDISKAVKILSSDKDYQSIFVKDYQAIVPNK